MNTITWLHLSDLHFRQKDEYNRTVVLKALCKDIKKRTSNISPKLRNIDFAVITGDIAYHGKSEEYELAKKQLFEQLLQVTGLSLSDIFVTPGNHDIDRTAVTTGARLIRECLSKRDQISQVLTTPMDRELVFSGLQNYFKFLKGLFPGLKVDDLCFYVDKRSVGGEDIAILGLNSAWLCYGESGDVDKIEEDKGKICVGEIQVTKALEHVNGAKIIIALLHHPFEWFKDNEDTQSVEFLLQNKCHFILRGHLHKANIIGLSTLQGDTVIIPAGAIYDKRNFPNSYNFVQLNLKTGTGRIYFRRYNDKRQEWIKDIESTGEEKNGQVEFRLPKQRKRSLTLLEPSKDLLLSVIKKQRQFILNFPVMPWTPERSPSFDFFWPELFIEPRIWLHKHPKPPLHFNKWLEKYKWEANIAIIGLPGIGKSTILRAISLKLTDPGDDMFIKPIPILTHASEIQRFGHSRYKSLVNYLISKFSIKIPKRYLSHVNFILLVDGLDEISELSIPTVLSTLINAISENTNITLWVACRKDFFFRYIAIKPEWNANFHEILELQEWDENKDSLVFTSQYAKKTEQPSLYSQLLKMKAEYPEITAFLRNPFELILLLYLLSDDKTLAYQHLKNSYALYKAFYEHWILREHHRGTASLSSKNVSEMHRRLALSLYSSKVVSINLTMSNYYQFLKKVFL